MGENDDVKRAVDRVLDLEAELESAGNASTASDDLAIARQALHAWVDTVVAVVASPGVGRVSLIHQNGRESRISSPDLPFLLSRPVTFSHD